MKDQDQMITPGGEGACTLQVLNAGTTLKLIFLAYSPHLKPGAYILPPLLG